MLIQQINRDDPEKVYVSVFNATGNTLTTGYAACYQAFATNSLGVAVTKPYTSALRLFVGCAAADVADEAYGLVQVYGYCASAYVAMGADSISSAGLGIGPVDGQFYLSSAVTAYPLDACGPSTSAVPLAAVIEHDISVGTGYVKAFIRAM